MIIIITVDADIETDSNFAVCCYVCTQRRHCFRKTRTGQRFRCVQWVALAVGLKLPASRLPLSLPLTGILARALATQIFGRVVVHRSPEKGAANNRPTVHDRPMPAAKFGQ